uniref:Uncharacterized protein n=1 Tax=Glossina brevipalpis TaxID=37001 RepID=A0A1A9WAP7_9MUSC
MYYHLKLITFAITSNKTVHIVAEEWITKRKTELTTTRQIETHVKRQLVFEDGKVIDDSGPIVSTNTTEDTDKQETETTEKHDLGLPVVKEQSATGRAQNKDALKMITDVGGELVKNDNSGGNKLIKKMVPTPADGLVREINEKRVISHEERDDYLETEDVQHLGDFSDEAFVKVVNSGLDNVEEVLLSSELQKDSIPAGKRIIGNTTKSYKIIDSEDIQKRSLAQKNGKIITEQKKETEHEVIVDRELSDTEKLSVTSHENIKTVEANQRYFKRRDEQHVDLIENGKVVGTEMRYAAETMQMENDNTLERPDDWDSLSDRMRKMRRPYNKAFLHHQKTGLLMDRKDALTKRPLDFDREEETRKGETIKWLESHFGSESTASNDSREDEIDIVEPTKKTYFNVTIKSNQNQNAPSTATAHYGSYDKRPPPESYDPEPLMPTNNGASKNYHSASSWNRRDTTPANHFSSKAFRDDLHATVERSQLRKATNMYSSRENLGPDKATYIKTKTADSYVSREDILQQKRQSISSQFLARSRQNSRDKFEELDKVPPHSVEDTHNISGSRTDLHYGLNVKEKDKRSFIHTNVIDEREPAIVPRKISTAADHTRVYENYNPSKRETTYHVPPSARHDINALNRPIVPQRRRNGEKKLPEPNSTSPIVNVPSLQDQHDFPEPPPDYSPPPRSRSSSPRENYYTQDPNRLHAYQRRYSPPEKHENVFNKQTHENSSALNIKPHQHTRFAGNTPSPPPTTIRHHTPRSAVMSSQTTQTTPSTLSTSTVTSHKSTKMGQAIGNSLRKLVDKFRSASVERKLRLKSKSKSREFPNVFPHNSQLPERNSKETTTTYQQYNVIDGHIGGKANQSSSREDSEQEFTVMRQSSSPRHATQTRTVDGNIYRNSTTAGNSRESFTGTKNPKQRYYLGEDPYSSSLYYKENLNEMTNTRTTRETRNGLSNNRDNLTSYYNERTQSAHTLGRYQKSNQRVSGSTPNLHHDYRSAQTLPRKLNDQSPINHRETPKVNKARNSNAVQNKSRQQTEQRITYQANNNQHTGALKPARTYPKNLNRSKSFSIHAMNGGNEPSPIYIEKSSNNNYSDHLHIKSNPHLYTWTKEQQAVPQNALKSPSIVNLISRSQKDLTKLGTNENFNPMTERRVYTNDRQAKLTNRQFEDRGTIYRSGSHADDDYKTQAVTRYQLQPKRSLDSRSSVEINKDTAGIIRYDEYLREQIPASGSTIIKVRNIDYRK